MKSELGEPCGGAILPTRSPPAVLAGRGFTTSVSAEAGMKPNSASIAQPWLTRTSVPGPRHVAIISFISARRSGFLPARSESRLADVSTVPTAISRAVSRQRHQGEETTRPTRTPRLRSASPSARACARPRSSRLRCVLQSSARTPGGSPVPGALPWRTRMTCPPLASAAQAAPESCAAAFAAAIANVHSAASRPGARTAVIAT
jgi:hypothetical protein